MDYRHTQHAGNAGDVFKHFMLAALLAHYVKDPVRLWYLETHAGAGLYDFPDNSGRAIFRVPANRVPPAILPALDQAWSRKAAHTSYYPGSPMIADTILRPQDRMTLFETSGADFGRLGEIVVREDLTIQYEDGFLGVPKALRWITPDAENEDYEAVIFIDPDYTRDDDWRCVLGTVAEISLARPGSTIIVWYPIFEHNPGIRRFDRTEFRGALAKLAIEEQAVAARTGADFQTPREPEGFFLWREISAEPGAFLGLGDDLLPQESSDMIGAGMCILNARPGTEGPLGRAILNGRNVYNAAEGNLRRG